MQIIDGKALAKKVRDEVKEKLQDNKFKSIPAPHLVVIQVGDDPASDIYIRNKKKDCEEVGIKFSHYHYKEETTEDHLIEVIERLSLTPTVTGILVQLPLPDHINTQNVIDAINPDKDVDGFTTKQAGMLQLGMKDKRRLLPCTAKGIIRLLESITDLEGKEVTVIGRSNIVGKPVAQLLQEKNATVILCHSKTDTCSIQDYSSHSDIVILATGQPKYFGSRFFYNSFTDYIIIDAGINKDKEGKLCGDLNMEDVSELFQSSYIKYTPVPGGVGPMTVAELIDNVYIAYENQFDFIWKYCQNLKISELYLTNFEKEYECKFVEDINKD